MKILQCKLTTIEALLGTASNNKELHSEFIASHAPDAPSREEETAARADSFVRFWRNGRRTLRTF